MRAREAAAPAARTRVLLFSTLYPNAVRPGHGVFVETRLRELRRRHASIDARVVAPVPWFPSRDARFGAWAGHARVPAFERRHGVDVHHPRYALLPKIGMSVAPATLAAGSLPTLRRLIAAGFDFDVIDAHYFYPDGVAAALLARHLGKPFVVTARGSDVNLIARHAVPRRWMRWAASRAAACIGVSAALVERMRELGFPAERLLLARNGVDAERFAPVDQAEARRRCGVDGAPVLLMVGHLVELKGHALAIRALPAIAERHPGVRLLIVGDGPERARLEALAAQAGVAERVRFVGAVANERLADWYGAADALVLASSREGWPNVLLEAMACGTPVAATAVGGVPEIVDEAVSGRLIPRRDSASIAATVLALLDARPAREALRRHALRHSWDETSRLQAELFGRLAAVGPRAAAKDAACAI